MKRLNAFLQITGFVLVLSLMGCASSGETRSSSSSEQEYDRSTTVKVDNPTISLADYLRRIPGVQVNGNGASARITVRGTNSFMSSTDPLFYVDDTRVGRNFASVSSMVSMSDVDNVEVIKGTETSFYGVEGGNGVIIIHTKRRN